MKRPVQGRWRQTSFSHYSILSLTNMALFPFRLVNYFKKSLRIAAGLLEKCMKVPKVVLGRELKQLGQKRILVLRCFKLDRVYKVEFLSRYFILFRSVC